MIFKFMVTALFCIFTDISKCMDIRSDYISELSHNSIVLLNNTEKYSDIKDNPAIIFDKFYDLFAAAASKHPLICVYAMYSALMYIAFSKDSEEYYINRICDLREKLNVLIKNDKYIKYKEQMITACKLADDVTVHIPYAGMVLCLYGKTKSTLAIEIKKEIYDKVFLVEPSSKNPLILNFHKFVKGISF